MEIWKYGILKYGNKEIQKYENMERYGRYLNGFSGI